MSLLLLNKTTESFKLFSTIILNRKYECQKVFWINLEKIYDKYSMNSLRTMSMKMLPQNYTCPWRRSTCRQYYVIARGPPLSCQARRKSPATLNSGLKNHRWKCLVIQHVRSFASRCGRKWRSAFFIWSGSGLGLRASTRKRATNGASIWRQGSSTLWASSLMRSWGLTIRSKSTMTPVWERH